MPRDISGNYSLPAGNPVVPNTIIASNWANTTMQDIADALTASLSIDGSVTTAKIADDAVTRAKMNGLDVNGMVAAISATEFEGRAITGTNNQIVVADGDGVSANPTLSLSTDLRLPSSVVRIVGSGTGDANVSALGFYESDGTTRKGLIGDGVAGDANIYLTADVGNIVITPTGGALLPSSDGTIDLGSVAQGFDEVFVNGVVFPGIQVASADANTLDDYEEGTWTPAISAATPGNLSVTYTSQVGRYTKIGRQVMVEFILNTSNFTHTTASGNLLVTGLPFASGATLGAFGILITGASLAYSAPRTAIAGVLTGATTSITFIEMGDGQNGTTTAITQHTSGANSVLIRSSFSYSVL